MREDVKIHILWLQPKCCKCMIERTVFEIKDIFCAHNGCIAFKDYPSFLYNDMENMEIKHAPVRYTGPETCVPDHWVQGVPLFSTTVIMYSFSFIRWLQLAVEIGSCSQ